MQANVFTNLPNELKTIEIDVEKRKFLINGEPFGKSMGFELVCNTKDGFHVTLKVDTRVVFADYTMSGKSKTADFVTSGLDD